MIRIKHIAHLLLFSVLTVQVAAQSIRKEYLLDKNWKFKQGDYPDAVESRFNDLKWKTVSVPHDWAIKGPFDGNNDLQKVRIEQNLEKEASVKSGRTGGLPFVGTGWYRLKFMVPGFLPGKKAVLLFDGAMSNARVYVNGKEAGFWPYGYNSFHLDVTSLLNPAGEVNTLAVRLENFSQSSRWYPGAGIYRNVHLFVTEDVHIPVWGTYLTTPVINKEFAKVNLKTKVEAPAGKAADLRLETEIRDARETVVASFTSNLKEFDDLEFEQNLVVKNPFLWSPETPVLYTAVSRLYEGKTLKDEYKTRFGIRSIKYEAAKGFSLNGEIRKFKGVCNHHDLGPLGTAVNTAALRHQLTLLKDMGCDAIRTSHNMPAPELVALCDEMGFMMMVESFDEWKTPKVKNGYSQYFDEWAEKDLVNMIHRDRNSPSVVMWSIGNEVPDQSAEGGNKIAKRLQDICHREDPTRPVTVGMDRINDALTKNFAAVLDIPGFNYKPTWYERANNALPQGFILGTETASTVSSRGVYKFPVGFQKMKQYDDNQSSSYDFEYCNWSQVPDDEFVKQDDLPFVIGEFVWTGFDYLGEPTPYDSKWPSHSSYFGIIDLASIPKDRFYLYRSKWNTSKPTLHILPHWTWPGREGEITPVFCYTNYPSAELFVNGKSMGRQSKSNTNNQTRYRLMWNDVKYEPGVIKVVAYDKDGKAVASEEVKTAGKPHHIELSANRTEIIADGKDLAYITAKVCDAEGNLCPQATNLLQFKVKGDGRHKAAANGDATSLELFHHPQMHVFKGMLTEIVQSSEKSGAMQLTVKSKGLKSGTLTIRTIK
ncbi:beta-galactosidase [Arcticibacter tournemirensis]|uniref:Glycoside hydrolase family 2 protein n=1 Tax=Arcticibacter tournemirensis TaxID=699437 RepID=A0A5M9GRU6_9SPHI|nr:beta-galactosidase GalB [Arcticibacter tournemirensis]KAA8477492.1 glycoside hydrolase family 2 protein [Arcticibacter tournemirensis]TQM51319.1 beta-galactosidase [Arcticibacter tournemirensis]